MPTDESADTTDQPWHGNGEVAIAALLSSALLVALLVVSRLSPQLSDAPLVPVLGLVLAFVLVAVYHEVILDAR